MLTREVAVAGIGYSPISRYGDPRVGDLARVACRAAIDDAGLSARDVDAIIEYQFGGRDDSLRATRVQQFLGINNLNVFNDILGSGPSGLAGALDAVMAVASGACETALVYRCISREAGHTGAPQAVPAASYGDAAFLTPYGYGGGIMMSIAMRMRRRMVEYGSTEEDYGRIALNARRWAALNERAVLREPLTMEDYLSSRVITEPLHLLDCDYPVNGACAVVITTLERARDLARTPVAVDSMAYGTGSNPDWVFADDFLYGGTIPCAKRLWSRTSLTPADVDVAELYDGFTHIAISWLEALGFCGLGEFGDWVEGGKRIGPDGELPLNTNGGQLAEGRMHGLAFVCEAVLQLRGDCGERQVPNASVAVVANAHGPQSGAMLLRVES